MTGMTNKLWTAVVVGLSALIFAGWAVFGERARFLEEDGPLETVSASLLFLGAVVAFVVIPKRDMLRRLYLPFVLFQLGVRELPGELWIFDERVLAAAFYREHGFSATSLVGGLYAAAAAVSLVGLVVFAPAALLRALRTRSPWLIPFAAAALAVAVAFLSELLLKHGLVPASAATMVHLVEEIAEMLFAVFLCLSVVSAHARRAG